MWRFILPSRTCPKTTCFESNQWVLAVQRKNCDPLVLGPALAIERTPGPVCFNLKFSSANWNRFFTDNQVKKKVVYLFTINWFTTGTIVFSEVTTLAHEVWNYAMESWTFEPKSLKSKNKKLWLLNLLLNHYSYFFLIFL